MFKYTKAQAVGISISFLIVISLSILIFFLFKNKSDKAKRIPQKIITILIVVSEIIKYSILLALKDFDALYPSYFCSFLWFWFLFADFTKGKFASSCQAVSFSGSVAIIFLLIVNPSSIVGISMENLFSSYLNLHHLLFHMLVILHLFVSLALKTVKFEKTYFIYIIIWVFILCAVIIPRAYISGINYLNLLYSQIKILENIRLRLGQIIYDIISISLMTIALEAILLIFYLIYQTSKKKNQ